MSINCVAAVGVFSILPSSFFCVSSSNDFVFPPTLSLSRTLIDPPLRRRCVRLLLNSFCHPFYTISLCL